MLLVFYKPFGVLSQFTVEVEGQRTLAEFGFPKDVYPVGRLDADSEGMLLLTDEGGLNHRLLDPKERHWRRYLSQVEGSVTDAALRRLAEGAPVHGRMTLPARAWRLDAEPDLPPRDPPIRGRKRIPTSWIALEIREGRNRQVRRMTAAAGFPTLRLARVRIGGLDLPGDLRPGCWRSLDGGERDALWVDA